MPPSRNAWAIYPRPNPSASLRLFCFPSAGGGAAMFRGWAQLSPEVEVVAVQPPGRENRLKEKPYSDVMELVAKMHEELRPELDKPFAFFGHSNGALMAFELTRALRRAGGPMPRALLVAGKPAPQMPIREPHIHALPEAEFIAELRHLGGTPEEVLENRELMELVTPILRADFSLGETYRYTHEPPLDVPIRAYGATRDVEVSGEEIEGWKEQSSQPITIRTFNGDHFFINRHPSFLLEMSQDLLPLVPRAHGG